MKTEKKQMILERLNIELYWRGEEYRFTQDAYRLLEITKEIRLLQLAIENCNNGQEDSQLTG